MNRQDKYRVGFECSESDVQLSKRPLFRCVGMISASGSFSQKKAQNVAPKGLAVAFAVGGLRHLPVGFPAGSVVNPGSRIFEIISREA